MANRWNGIRVFPLLAIVLLSGCFEDIQQGSGDSGGAPNTWTWISGSNLVDQAGVFGTKGTADSANVPGRRRSEISWREASGNFWLFGGDISLFGLGNDLWRWDGANWTWMSGASTVNQTANYGVIDTANSANVPGARYSGVSWIDTSGDFWLFGGWGYPSSGGAGLLNDLWRWDGANWTWMSGSTARDQPGFYGTKNFADPANVPGARQGAVSWIDASGNIWLFGGDGFISVGTSGNLNDLWRWDGSNWTWISGSNAIAQSGVYGFKGIGQSSNHPGARSDAISWKDSTGNFWLFGGIGYDSAGTLGSLNDLWRWDGSFWAWMSGSITINQSGTHGTKGKVATSNIPGARSNGVGWVDGSDRFWLFGGSGYDSAGVQGRLNDLWMWNGANWTWISGADLVNETGVYGKKGTAAATNVPGARYNGVSWIDGSSRLWIFGGYGYDTDGILV